jgi:hypothetical protein
LQDVGWLAPVVIGFIKRRADRAMEQDAKGRRDYLRFTLSTRAGVAKYFETLFLITYVSFSHAIPCISYGVG